MELLATESNAIGYRRAKKAARKMSFHSMADAGACIGALGKNCEIFCLSRGQFSLFNAIEYILDFTGPADVVIATWTAQGADTSRAKQFLLNGAIKGMRWIVDASFISRQPEYCEELIKNFGNCIRAIRTHAKFCIIGNEKWKFVIRTSMNFNKNIRCEDIEISEDEEFYNYLLRFTDEIFTKFSPGEWRRDKNYDDRLQGWDDDTTEAVPVEQRSVDQSTSYSTRILQIKEEKERIDLETAKTKLEKLKGGLLDKKQVSQFIIMLLNQIPQDKRARAIKLIPEGWLE